MRYAGIIKNDVSAGEGVCVSFFVQGCAFHCPGCHNPQTWDFKGGYEFTQDTLDNIIKAISANGITRNFCVMGGEPMHDDNLFLTNFVIQEIKRKYPTIKIYVWSGYTYQELLDRHNKLIDMILDTADVLVDGRYIEKCRDITLPMRGSSNQKIIDLKEKKEL